MTCRSSSNTILDMKSEFTTMKLLLHPHIVRAYEAINDNGMCYLIAEYCAGGELFDRIISKVTFTEKEVQILIGQIMDAIYYMHTIGIVHRDIKPENILYFNKSRESIIKITDFGVSKIINYSDTNINPELHSFIASKYYVAPEILEENPCYTKEVDCWAVGIIIYIILIGYAPFDGKTSLEVYKKIRKKPVVYYTKEWKKYSQESLHFTKSLLTKNPKERMTSKSAVEHPWLNGPNLHKFHFNDAIMKTIPRFLYSNISTMDSFLDSSLHLGLDKTSVLTNPSTKTLAELKQDN